MRHFVMILWFAAVLAGCAANGYREFYRSYPDAPGRPDARFLKKGQAPIIRSSDNLESDIRILLSKGFLPVGESSFNGVPEKEDKVVSQALQVGALIVLVNSTYTNTQAKTALPFFPNNSKIYGSGSFYGSGGFAPDSSPGTPYGTAAVPSASQERRFDQTAVYFVKSGKKPGFGLVLVDLVPELEKSPQQNSGVMIDVVVEGSPAFYAGVLPGDILIQVDGVDVRDMPHALALMKAATSAKGESQLKILRNTAEKVIKIRLDVTP